MRQIAITGMLLLFGCKAAYLPGQSDPPETYVICIEYGDQQAETNVLHILNRMTILEQVDIRRNGFTGSVVVTCNQFKDLTIDVLQQQLQQTEGVLHVVVNPN